MREVIIRNEQDTRRFGMELAGQLKPGDIIALIGDLGKGTFTIVKEYRSGRLPLFHFDVYRIQSSEELFQTGAEEYFDAGGVCVIEWADQIAEILPDDTRCIFLEYGEKEGERIYRCTF